MLLRGATARFSHGKLVPVTGPAPRFRESSQLKAPVIFVSTVHLRRIYVELKLLHVLLACRFFGRWLLMWARATVSCSHQAVAWRGVRLEPVLALRHSASRWLSLIGVIAVTAGWPSVMARHPPSQHPPKPHT